MPQELEQKTKTELTASQVDAFEKFSKLKVGALFILMLIQANINFVDVAHQFFLSTNYTKKKNKNAPATN